MSEEQLKRCGYSLLYGQTPDGMVYSKHLVGHGLSLAPP